MANNIHITDDLLVKYLLGEALQNEKESADEWIHISAENERYFNHFKTIWESSIALANTIPLDEKAAWQRFKTKLANNPIENSKQKGVVINLFAKRFLAAAAVVILIAGAWWLFNNNNTSNIAMLDKTTTSQVAVDTLSDGSIITLNKNTKLTYPSKFKGKTRPVTLKGEAFFKVAPDKLKPFIIKANDVTITVVGTAFNVKNYDSSTEVIVESGIVRVTKNNASIELVKGEKIILSNDGKMEKQKVTDSIYNFYRTRKIVCNETSLPQLVQWLNEAYNADISLGDSSLNSLEINTEFNNESLDNIINIIQQTFGLKTQRNGDKIIFYPGE